MARIISVHSFRGGTGKSNLTANLAVTTASHGKRVGIVDTDIQSPGIHVIFGFDEDQINYALNDYLWGRCSIHDTAYDVGDRLSGKDLQGGVVYLVPSSLKAGEIARVLREGFNVGLLNDGFQDLIEKLNLDFLFIDTHPGLNEETLLSIAISDALVIIMRPDRQDFQGTAVTVDVARKLDVPELWMLVNKMPRAYDRQSVKKEVESSYNATVLGLFQENDEMLQLASSDVFCLRFPDHEFSQEVRNVAQVLLG